MYEQQEQTNAAVTIFYSYAHEDEHLREELETHLSLLRRRGIISEWHDRKIAPGTNWTQAIDAHLMTAQIILLLISPDFLNSDYCYGVELHQALERQKTGEAIVIPLLLRPVDWENAPFAQLQCLPRNGKPVTSWGDRDEAFATIARELRGVIEAFHPTAGSADTPRIPQVSLSSQGPDGIAAPRQPARSPTTPIDLSRRRILERVRKTWITGVLEQSLYGAVFIELGLQHQPDALANPWRLVVQETNQPARPLPAGTSIIQVSDQAEGALLILGEPGAGKTTLLLELARELLNRAQIHENDPIPAIFNLSSWAKKQQSLDSWLVEELFDKYEVSRNLGTEWVRNDRLLLLLDGLDEVAPAVRQECIQTINQYRREHPLVPLVVCSRSADYLNQPARLRLHTAVVVQPLTLEQIEQYLAQVGEQATALRKVLLHDSDLLKVATAPLMLNVLMLAYQGVSAQEITTSGPLQSRQEQIFASYVERMLTRRGTQSRYSQEHIRYWLTWLAQQMQRQHMTDFYVERLQLTWLPTKHLRWLYALLIGLIFGSGFWLCMGLFFGPTSGLLLGLLLGLFFGLNKRSLEIRPRVPWRYFLKHVEIQRIEVQSWRSLWLSLVFMLALALLLVLISVPIPVLISVPIPVLLPVLLPVLTPTLLMGLYFVLMVGLLRPLNRVLVDRLKESSNRQINTEQDRKPNQYSLRSGWYILGSMLLLGLFSGLLLGLFSGLFFGLFFGLFYALLLGLFFGLTYRRFRVLAHKLDRDLSNGQVNTEQDRKPNQNILRSGWYALRSMLVCGLIVWLIFGGFVPALAFWLSYGLIPGLTLWLSYGLIGGLTSGLFYGLSFGLIGGLAGGRAYLQHYILRFLLWRSGAMPWHYVRFLDYAAERILLRKVGGGYIFTHPLLLEYFAALESSDRAAQPSSEALSPSE